MTPPKKTVRQLAEEDWIELEGILLEEMRTKMRLYQVGYIHGYHKGKEDTSGVRTRTRKR